MHYEIEQAGAGDDHRPDVGTHAEPEHWHTVNVLNADAAALRHARASPGLRRPDARDAAGGRGGRRRRARAGRGGHTRSEVNTRACPQLSQTTAAARWMAPRKWTARLS